ncbi:MAG TPA: hypothetical protein VI612_05500 [Candidatus Nanoarchaeia archaeon]|nr:hypothetical protein [Candidatus Nanoarchaeia archaeon]
MVEATNGLFVSDRLREMVRKYAANPNRFFSNGHISETALDTVIASQIAVDPQFKDGRACIIGTPVMVCEIVGDTLSLRKPVGFERYIYGGIIPPEAIDAAYAFLMRNHDKVVRDFEDTYGSPVPQDLYQ